MEMWHRVGLTEARWVDAAEVSRMVPVLNVEDVLGCTFCPTDGIASPADVTSGYAAAAKRHGARLKEGVEVIGVDVAAGRGPSLPTPPPALPPPIAFNCAGASAPALGQITELADPLPPDSPPLH